MKKGVTCRQPTPFCSIKMPFGIFNVVTFRMMVEMFPVFHFIPFPQICTSSVGEYLNNNNDNQLIYYPRLYVLMFLKLY